MASSDDRLDAGFATLAASAISLALALIMALLMQGAVRQAISARSDLARTAAEYELAGRQALAVEDLMRSDQQARLRWEVDGARILAEPERAKLSAIGAPSSVFSSFGVADPASLARRIGSDRGRRPPLSQMDPSPLWRDCAASMLSRHGQGRALALKPAVPLRRGGANLRVSQVWRITVSAAGWTDERIVRFTGEPDRPADTLERAFGRMGEESAGCEARFAG